jgi:hypothetical protein
LTKFIQGGNHPKAQILEIQDILHCISKKRKITVWKPNDEGRENANIVETSGHQVTNATIGSHTNMKMKDNQTLP